MGPFANLSYEKLVDLIVQHFGPTWGKWIARTLVATLFIAALVVIVAGAGIVLHKGVAEWVPGRQTSQPAKPAVAPGTSVAAKKPLAATPPNHAGEQLRRNWKRHHLQDQQLHDNSISEQSPAVPPAEPTGSSVQGVGGTYTINGNVTGGHVGPETNIYGRPTYQISPDELSRIVREVGANADIVILGVGPHSMPIMAVIAEALARNGCTVHLHKVMAGGFDVAAPVSVQMLSTYGRTVVVNPDVF